MKPFVTFFFSALALSLQFTHAQSNQATTLVLSGDVQADSQQVLVGAAITVVHVPSGTRYSAASNAAGHFAVPNLPAGGPYLVQVGEGGYKSQTVENIFLDRGKPSNISVTLARVGTPGKGRAGRTAAATAPAEQLAPESEVGGPVLFAANTAPASQSPGTSGRRYQPVPQIITTTPPSPAGIAAAPRPARELAPAPTAISTPAKALVPGSPYRHSTTGPRRITPPAQDFIVPGRYDAKSGNYIYDTGAATTLQLPGGATITNVGVNSTESLLYRFLADPAKQVDTLDLSRGWFNFDRVFFETGKATLTPESVGQLRNIVTLLRAYPKARIKVGGYTDSTGTYKVNRMLSEARARTAWASLVEMGISAARIDARGYGPRYGIAPNASEEGRAQNRRLSIKVLMK